MIFDKNLQRGVKRRYIPPPKIFSFPSNTSYKDIIQKGVERFFPDDIEFTDMFCLADSTGIPYEIEEKDTWCLSEFIQQSGQPPSKLRLYIMNFEKVVSHYKSDNRL